MGWTPTPGDRVRIVGWNCNSLWPYLSQIGFINKIRKTDGDIFVLYDTRLKLTDEARFKKLWGETCFFNSYSGERRGIAVLIKDGTAIDNIEFHNVIKGNFSKLTFSVNNEAVLVKCIYAPNPDMNLIGPDNESRAFSRKSLMIQTRRNLPTKSL